MCRIMCRKHIPTKFASFLCYSITCGNRYQFRNFTTFFPRIAFVAWICLDQKLTYNANCLLVCFANWQRNHRAWFCWHVICIGKNVDETTPRGFRKDPRRWRNNPETLTRRRRDVGEAIRWWKRNNFLRRAEFFTVFTAVKWPTNLQLNVAIRSIISSKISVQKQWNLLKPQCHVESFCFRKPNEVKPVFHLANLFARTGKKQMWLAGDVVSVFRQPITLLFFCSREQIRQVENRLRWNTDIPGCADQSDCKKCYSYLEIYTNFH